MIRKRSPQVKKQLLYKSREAALNAVQTFNNPLTTFKTETFIVLMNIAWMYLLHAYYRREGVEYRYYTKGRSGGSSTGPNREPSSTGNLSVVSTTRPVRWISQPNSTLNFLSVCAMKLNIISLLGPTNNSQKPSENSGCRPLRAEKGLGSSVSRPMKNA